MPSADWLIEELSLSPHPEGGYFRETYRSTRLDSAGRSAATTIYFMLKRGQVSKLHRIDADEGWHLYLGGPVEVYELDERDPNAPPLVTRLGSDIAKGERPQHIVPAGRWFGAALQDDVEYALVGCTVAPGFEFAQFELGHRAGLLDRFPAARDLVIRLT